MPKEKGLEDLVKEIDKLVGLAILDDTDTNGIEEAGVLLIRDSDGRILVQGRNAAGSSAPRVYWFSP